MKPNVEQAYTSATENGKQAFKKNIYDWLSAAILVAIIVIGLDIFNLREVNSQTLKNLVIEWIPFFFAATLLDRNLYNKGQYIAKTTKNYIATMQEYSDTVSKLTGHKLKCLAEFCKRKNEKVLREIQSNILKAEGINIDDFAEIKKLTKLELKERFNDEQIKVILKAKKVKITGLKVNLLLGSNNVNDETDIGQTELEITKRHILSNTLTYILSTAVMTLIGIKDILLWGWAGILVIIFKTAYTFVKAYMSYFKGYSDITIKVVNHIARKTDILKEYDDFYNENCKQPELS